MFLYQNVDLYDTYIVPSCLKSCKYANIIGIDVFNLCVEIVYVEFLVENPTAAVDYSPKHGVLEQ